MKKFFIYSGIIFAILLMAYFGISFYLVQSTAAHVQARRQAILDAGDNVYLTDYQTDAIPDEENAYHHLMLAKSDLESFDERYAVNSEFLDLNHRLRPEQVEELAAIVEKYADMYDRLEQSAACKVYQPKVDYADGMAILLPDVALSRTAARALSAKALVEAYRGNGDVALKQCETTLRISNQVGAEPILINHLVDLACQSIAAQTANHTLRVADTSPDARASLDEVLSSLDNRQGTIDAMKGERAMGVQTFQQMRDGTLDPDGIGEPELSPLSALASTWLGQAYLNDDEAMYIEILDRQIEAVELDRDARRAEMDKAFADLEENSGFRHVLTRLLVPALNAAVDATDRREAENRCLRLLLAVEGQHDANLLLLDLPGDCKTDPFSGGFLLMNSDDDEWTVYSVGENKIDDGGQIHALDYNQPLDIGLGMLLDPLEATDDGVAVYE